MSLRTRRWLVLLASLMLVVVACTPGGEASPTPQVTAGEPTDSATEDPTEEPTGDATEEPTGDATEEPTGDATEEPTEEPTDASPSPDDTGTAGGRLVMAIDGQITQLTNALSDVPTAEAVQFLYNGLYRYNTAIEPVPDLAAEPAEISEDGLTWTITLVDNATFQPSGDTLTAADVEFTYQLSNSPNCRYNPSVCLANVTVPDPEGGEEPVKILESVEAVDDSTVQFVLAAPYAPFATVTLPGTLIDSEAAVRAAYEEFNAGAEAVENEITDLKGRIDAEAALVDDEGNPTGDMVQFRAELEQILADAGIEDVPQPDPEVFAATDDAGEPTGELDEDAYVGALVTIFNDLANSRAAADEIDAIAAAYPLLSISREPVGTGPFYLVNFRPGQDLEYARNEQYHFGTPQIEEMFLPIITDEVAAASAIQGGTVDWKYSLTADAYAQLQNDPNVKFAEYPDFGYFGLQFNLRDGKLFADKNLRQAVAYCAQKEDIVNVATEGQGVPIYADIPPASWAYNPEVEQYGFDVEQGVALIEEAGWTEGADGVYEKDGQRLATEVLVRAGKPDRIAFMQLLSDQLNSNCGFDMSIREVDFGTVLVPMLSWPHMQQGKTGNELEKQFDAYFGGWGTGFDPDPYALWHSSQCTTADQPDTYNYICFQNDRADELIQEGLAELDQDARAEIYQEFEAILAEDLPYLFAWSDVAREALRTSISTTEGDLQLNSPQWHWELHNLTNTAAE